MIMKGRTSSFRAIRVREESSQRAAIFVENAMKIVDLDTIVYFDYAELLSPLHPCSSGLFFV